MSRERERERKSWRDVDRGRTQSQSYRAEEYGRIESPSQRNAAAKEYRAALEALFQKKPEAVEKIEKMMPSIVLPKVVQTATEGDTPAVNRRQDMLRKINAAQGSKPISDTIDAFLQAGYVLPDDQEIFLQMLEHRDETRVREAIQKLEQLLMGQLPRRKPVLVQRLKRLEEHAEDDDTRSAAAQLRRKVA